MKMATKDGVRVCMLTLLLMLSWCGMGTTQLWITAYNESSASHQEIFDIHYFDSTLFSMRYANVDYMQGFVHFPTPNNGCSVIPPLPNGLNNSWFALITDYPVCPQDMILHVRSAGYTLVIVSSHNDSNMTVTQSIKDSGFPFVIVSQSFAQTLQDNVSRDPLDGPSQIGVKVTALLGLSVFVVVFSFVSCCLCSCLLGCCVCVCRSRHSRLREEQEFYEEYRDRQRNYEQIQRRERFARQELIESILRQLQELQVDLRTQIPLGRDETNRLPTRPYHSGQSKCDTCAICVEEFQQGESLRWLPCEHSFHPQCIDEWLTNHSSLCPLCKAAVPRRDGDTSSDSESTTSTIPLSQESPLLGDNDRRYGSV